MTRRFDRTNVGEKIHVLSLCGMMHYDYNTPRTYSYEDALSVVQRLNLGSVALRELYRRMVFNVLARNQDDHTRNIEFLMNSAGTWSLAPAYDMTWSYHEDSRWTNRHQMLVNGKSDQFTKEDLLSVAKRFGIKRAEDVLQEVFAAVKRWPEFAEDVDVPHETINRIRATHRCGILVN